MSQTLAVFDAYGTLFDVSAAAREAASEPGFEVLRDKGPAISAHWRAKQLGYSWLRATAGKYISFWQVTQDALDWAMAAEGVNDPVIRERLLALYFELSAYPEVPEMLRALKSRGIRTAILSNGSKDMLDGAVMSAGIGPLLNGVLSVEDVEIFKPAPAVYDMVGNAFDTQPNEVLFVSSNGWDAAAASGYGFRTAWVNRAGEPRDILWSEPNEELCDLTTIPDLI